MYSIHIREIAYQEIGETAQWYEDKQNGLGDRFFDEVEEALETLKLMPKAYAIVYKDTRRILLNKFPFAIHYFIEDSNIVVFAVLHGSRDPKHWQNRID